MNKFKTNIINIYGERGKNWLKELPDFIASLAKKYGLSELSPVPHLSYNYVLSGFQNDTPIVLKLGLDVACLKQEAIALKVFAGFGAVKILAEEDGVLILERVLPGDSLESYFPLKDDEAIRIAASVMKHLHQAPVLVTGTFPHIRDWLEVLDKEYDIPINYLQKARHLRDQLLQTTEKEVLLHGDLHHDNILKNGDEWVIIDPKGVIGDPAYETAAFIRNPMPGLLLSAEAVSIIKNRITTFAKLLDLPENRILDWCFVQAVLAWVWALEDKCDTGYWKQITEIFDKIKRA